MNSREILSRVIEISNAPVDVDQRLGHLVDFLSHSFSVPYCALFIWDPREGRVFLKLCSAKHPNLPAGLSFPVGEETWGAFLLQKKPMIIPDAAQLALWSLPLPENFASFRFLAFFPVADEIFLYGVLAFLEEQPRQFSEEESFLLPVICRQLAGTLRSNQVFTQAKKRIAQLSTLQAISNAISSTLELGELLNLITLNSAQVLQADGAILRLLDEEGGMLKVVSTYGLRDEPDEAGPPQQVPLGEDVAGAVALTHEPILISDVQISPYSFAKFPQKISSIICVPLIFRSKTIGTLTLFSLYREWRPVKVFDEEDKNLLTTMASPIAIAIENARLYSNLQEINTQLLQAQNRLIQSEKLAALGEVVASITHEIKNPLVSIGGFARRLERNFQENSPEKKYIRIILKEVKRLESTLNATLAYSKEPSIPTGHYELNRILEDTLFILDSEFHDRNIRVTKNLAPNLPPLFSDPQQLNQVFLNLLVNAMQAIGKEGNLVVKTSCREQGERKFIQVEVSDTGGGIPLEVLDNIFNPFFTTKQDGTGLGLAIAHKIVTQHQGEIEVVNHPGVGATFLIRFPLSE
ncbi:MAG: GAF domain-containing protein [Proteobacteria bacterium]|nr:GAF domain-containing protein [Pseudomonadota bacterium]